MAASLSAQAHLAVLADRLLIGVRMGVVRSGEAAQLG
jgi:hypothetical protein